MIQSMCLDLDAALEARKFPVNVHYGPEYAQQDNARSRILIERDRDSGDTLAVVKGTGSGRNPLYRGVRNLGCVCTVWAQSSLPGAMHHNHEDLCDLYVDAIATAIDDWLVEAKTGARFSATSAKFLNEDEIEARYRQQWAGVVYEMRFAVPRGIFKRDGEGAARPESGDNVTGVGNTTNVYLANGPDGAPAEVGCGV